MSKSGNRRPLLTVILVCAAKQHNIPCLATILFIKLEQQAVTVVTLIVAIPTASVVIIQSNEVAQATIHRLYILILQGPVKGQIAQPQLYPGRMEPFMNICISTGMQQIVLRARELRADVFFCELCDRVCRDPGELSVQKVLISTTVFTGDCWVQQ